MSVRVGVTDDLAACLELRRVVFIEEQNVSLEEEQDGRDGEAIHLLARQDGMPVGCARLLVAGETGKIGRVCVLPAYRGTGLGRRLMVASLDVLRATEGVRQATLGAQVHALAFYEKLGFRARGEEFLDAGIAHREMVRDL